MAAVVDNSIASKLLGEAIRLFAAKGYRATSTREIVEAAGVTKPMLYYYYQNKEGLLAAALGHFVEMFHGRLRQVIAQPLTPRELLVELVWAHLDFCQDHKPLGRLFFALLFGPDDQKNLVDLAQYTDPGHELLMQGVARALDGELVRRESGEEFAMALHGMINIWIIASLNGDAELTHSTAERIVDGLLSGYGTHCLNREP
ncbi:MAG: TetR/AcrR family transcriptional regulator [Pirellulales bacterium]